ncbi:uncharacterized protein LOC114262608 isoform X1 [Camellia sinensis]|uniref:uncharacterized protein LOC114262608 isoform X1 n=1 Tax=Camellia sinensis TaxID=4442 RepID=UPI001036EFAC|nr:uncharacterized protein LOC114262608 isoform X1 [Camellia sinensis]
MAEHLASIFGTEKDRVNCPFYFKIGACRHGDRCSRLHTKPSISPTLLLSNMYQRPDMITPGVDPQGQPLDPQKIQHHFEDFYEDLFEELSKYGEIESLNICDNLADHMVGNVYVQFREEEHAANALQNLTGRFYAGNPIIVDFSPVTDFREATCRQYEEDICNRGGYCNFMHLKKIKSCGGNYSGGGVGEGTAVVHSAIAIMRSVRMEVAVVLVGEVVMTEIIATVIGAGGLEAEVQDKGEDEAEAPGNREIGAQLGKAVLREEQRSSSGIGKGNKQNLLTRMVIATMIMTTVAVALLRMENIMMTVINNSTSKSMEVTTTDPCLVLAIIVCSSSLQDLAGRNNRSSRCSSDLLK